MTWPAALALFYSAAAVPILWDHAVDLGNRLALIADYTPNNTDLPLAGGLAQVGTTNRNRLT